MEDILHGQDFVRVMVKILLIKVLGALLVFWWILIGSAGYFRLGYNAIGVFFEKFNALLCLDPQVFNWFYHCVKDLKLKFHVCNLNESIYWSVNNFIEATTFPGLLLDVIKLGCDVILQSKTGYGVEHPMHHDLHDARHLSWTDAMFEVLEDESKHILHLYIDHAFRDWTSRVKYPIVDEAVHVMRHLVEKLVVAYQLQLVRVEHEVIKHLEMFPSEITTAYRDASGNDNKGSHEDIHFLGKVLAITFNQISDICH